MMSRQLLHNDDMMEIRHEIDSISIAGCLLFLHASACANPKHMKFFVMKPSIRPRLSPEVPYLAEALLVQVKIRFTF
jgi:hypothetical protein